MFEKSCELREQPNETHIRRPGTMWLLLKGNIGHGKVSVGYTCFELQQEIVVQSVDKKAGKVCKLLIRKLLRLGVIFTAISLMNKKLWPESHDFFKHNSYLCLFQCKIENAFIEWTTDAISLGVT